MAAALVAPFIPPLIALPSVPRRPRSPAWADLLAVVAYLADKPVWSAEEIAHVALLQVIAPDHIREILEDWSIRHGRSDRLLAKPTRAERELAKELGLDPWVLQMFEDEQRPPGLVRRGTKQGGRKRRKKAPGIRKLEPWERW